MGLGELLLLALGVSRRRAFLAGVASGAVEPIAAGLMMAFAPMLLPLMPALLGFAAGAMGSVILLELAPELGQSAWGTVCFGLGFVLMAG